MSNAYDLASIGTATGSRVDSAAKHIMACKVDSRVMMRWMPVDIQDKMTHLHLNKLKWCMHKDEIVLNSTKKLNNKFDTDTSTKAYPMVLTTVGDMHKGTKDFLKKLYAKASPTEFFNYVKLLSEGTSLNQEVLNLIPVVAMEGSDQRTAEDQNRAFVTQQIQTLPDFRCQGIALGQAFASHISGDTVASVLVGGMFTVLNGAFAMFTGDEVQWYFEFEDDKFQHGTSDRVGDGMRFENPDLTLSGIGKRKKTYQDERLYGLGSGFGGKAVGQKMADTVVRIKSYKMKTISVEAENAAGDVVPTELCMDHYGDKKRIFAKCISGGRPYDHVDIMIMTQSS